MILLDSKIIKLSSKILIGVFSISLKSFCHIIDPSNLNENIDPLDKPRS